MKRNILLALLMFALFSCRSGENKENTQVAKSDDDWIYLFDGTSTDGWRAYNGEELPPQWTIEDGALTFDTEMRLETEWQGGKDIIYGAEEFDNFELYMEWKLPPGGNSGIFYHLKENEPGGPPEISPEYQLLDDLQWEEINNATLAEWQKTGADYAMYPADTTQKIIKPAGEWNSSRIIFTPEKVEHWLNGNKIVSFVPWSDDWYKRKAAGKWKNSPKYGSFKKGYIGLQDHDSPLWFRNIKVKKL